MIAPALFLYLDLGTFGGFLAQFAINQLSGKVVIGAGAANGNKVRLADLGATCSESPVS